MQANHDTALSRSNHRLTDSLADLIIEVDVTEYVYGLAGLINRLFEAICKRFGTTDEIERVAPEYIGLGHRTCEREDAIVRRGNIGLGVPQVLGAFVTARAVIGVNVRVPPSPPSRDAGLAKEHVGKGTDKGCQYDEYDPGEPRITRATLSKQDDRDEPDDQPDVGDKQKCGPDPLHGSMVVGAGRLCKSATYKVRGIPQIQDPAVVLIDAAGRVKPFIEPQ